MNARSLLGAVLAFVLVATPLHAADAPARVVSLDELFTLLDTDHDGRLSKAEATGDYARRFAQWDANGDGFATRQEIHDFRLRLGIDDNGRRIASGTSSKAATILKEPADWRLETMPVPPGFAPDVSLSGVEEIRFAPGMFDNTSDTYFTCVLAIMADGAAELGTTQIQDFLEKYYRGLSTSRASRTGKKADPAQMHAVVTAGESTNRFDARVDFFDSFSDGRKITLNVEAQVIPLPAKKQTFLFLLVSPSPKDSAAWETLRDIGGKTLQGLSALPASNTVKWHPGHYAFVQSSALDERDLYPGFRGVQKTYTWSSLEPEKDRYDFAAIRADLAFLGQHDQQLVIQVQTKTFGAGQNDCPAYLSAAEYDGGVYRTRWGSFNPIIWNEKVNQRLNALYARLGKELDQEPFLEAVVIPESATTFDNTERDKLHYTSDAYTRAVEAGMKAMKEAFPSTVVIQYVNMPPESIQALADDARQQGVGFGGPDIYPYDPVLTNPQRGVYRLYSPLAGIVPLGAAVQQNDYTQKTAFRGTGGETPVREIYEFGRDRLHLNYIFWGTRAGYFEKVQAMMAEASFPKDPAGGLDASAPRSLGKQAAH